MRKSGGVVKFLPGRIDDRKVDADSPWMLADGDEDISPDSEDDSGEGEDISDNENESSEHDTEDEEEPAPTLPVANQKRKRQKEIVSSPNKKVAFAPDPKGSKQSRLAGSLKAIPKTLKSKSTKIPQTPTSKPKKVANVATKSSKGTAATESGQEAYDFGKFF